MKMFEKVNVEEKMMVGDYSLHEHDIHRRPIPPHERKAMMNVMFDENDCKLLNEIFGDEDTASAAAEIIKDAPPEIQILAIQLMNIIEEVA